MDNNTFDFDTSSYFNIPDKTFPPTSIDDFNELLNKNDALLTSRSFTKGPLLSFNWLCVLFRLLLNAQIPSIRKMFVHRLLM
jgi:hypothetical protein